MTLPLLMVLVGEPHRVFTAWCTTDAVCACDKDTPDARVGMSFAAYGLPHATAFAPPTRATQKAALAALQAQCQAACDAAP